MSTVAEQIVEALAGGLPLPPQTRRSINTYPILVDGRQRKIVQCSDCGDSFGISSRAIRAARAQGRGLLCLTCRKPATVRVTSIHQAYWLERMTQAEIVELAVAIWGPPETWVSI